MTSDYVIVSTKLCPEGGNDEYIILCNFGDCRTSGSEIIEGDPHRSPLSQDAKQKPGLNRVKYQVVYKTCMPFQ